MEIPIYVHILVKSRFLQSNMCFSLIQEYLHPSLVDYITYLFLSGWIYISAMLNAALFVGWLESSPNKTDIFSEVNYTQFAC